jgi:DNA-binding transcriptional LysR family regulator
MFDVRRLRVLSEVSAHGSFSGAAAALALTQSAVSQHIAALEREVGSPLVERGTRPVQLTEAGSALARHTTGILARLDAAEQELAVIAGRRRDRLRFGCFPTVLGTLMPSAFARFRRSHPDVRLTIVDDHLHRLVPRMDDGELDLAVIYDHEALPDVATRDLVRTPLLDDRFQAVLPASHPLARRKAGLHLRDLRNEPWIGGAPSSAWYLIVRHACQKAGFTPEAGFASDDYIAVQALVAAGLGVSILPGLAVAHPLPGVAVRQLASGAPFRRISAVCPLDGYRSPAIDAMIDSLQISAKAMES